MHRSLLNHLRRQMRFGLIKREENGRICIQMKPKSSPSQSPCVAVNSFHTSFWCGTGNDRKGKNNTKSKPSKKQMVNRQSASENEQIEEAAIQAAKSLPGDWTRTADELMSRLSMQVESPPETTEENPDKPQSSLLSTMKIGRSFERKKAGSDGPELRPGVQSRMLAKKPARKGDKFTALYSQQRLGIFNAGKIKDEAGNAVMADSDSPTSLWHVVAQEKLAKAQHALPRNGFEEMVDWTKEGRMWTFPVDNEEGMDEERQYKFHDHVFLHQHLKEFPREGPIRRFMDLVVLGLGKNPWISVPEKVEHIKGFADYFRQKQEILEASIGEKAKMRH